ncbi:MAG: TetR/AcrR family transcriptional regulator [Pseudomonadota bacterium]
MFIQFERMANLPSAPVSDTQAAVSETDPAVDVPSDLHTKQERILTAALELFARRGYQATAVPDIASAAGVATGTIYRYFDTKDDLLNVLYQRWRGELNAHVFAPVPQGSSAREVFGELWRRLTGWLDEYPSQATFLEQHYHKPLLDRKSLEADRDFVQGLEHFILDAVASGEIRNMPSALAVGLIWGSAVGLLKMAGEGHLSIEPSAVAQAEASLWDALRSQAQHS